MRGRSLNIVSEPASYSLVLRSRKPEAVFAGSRTTSSQRFTVSGSYPRAAVREILRTYAEAPWPPPRRWPSRASAKDARIAELEPAAAFWQPSWSPRQSDFDARRRRSSTATQHPHGRGTPVRARYGEGIDRDNRPYRRHVDADASLVERTRPWHNGKTGQSGVDHQARTSRSWGVRDLHGKAARHRTDRVRDAEPSCFLGTRHDHAAAGLHGQLRPRFICDTCGKGLRDALGRDGALAVLSRPRRRAALRASTRAGASARRRCPDRPARRRLYGEDTDPVPARRDGWRPSLDRGVAAALLLDPRELTTLSGAVRWLRLTS